MPLNDTYWGARFGMSTDKYRVKWMSSCGLKKQELLRRAPLGLIAGGLIMSKPIHHEISFTTDPERIWRLPMLNSLAS